MAMGDGYNDVPMMRYAGLSVAMANGCEETKAAADHITCSNDEDGVAEAVKAYILER